MSDSDFQSVAPTHWTTLLFDTLERTRWRLVGFAATLMMVPILVGMVLCLTADEIPQPSDQTPIAGAAN